MRKERLPDQFAAIRAFSLHLWNETAWSKEDNKSLHIRHIPVQDKKICLELYNDKILPPDMLGDVYPKE